MSLDELIAEYVEEQCCDDIKLFGYLRSFDLALTRAATGRDSFGQNHPHQFRIPRRARSLAGRLLQGIKRRLSRARSFDELHEIIRGNISTVTGINDLYIYDVASRLGGFLDLHPERIYLHAGTRRGALALDLGRGKDLLEVEELPTPLRRLAPYQIEDFLCIYNVELKRLRKPS